MRVVRIGSICWIATLTGVCALALISARYIRYDLIEPASIGAFCETASTHTTHWRCLIRQAVLALLTEQRLGWLSIAAALLSLVLRMPTLGWCAWFLASTGFVLYNAELAAPALLLAGLALTRARHSVHNRRRGEQHPTPSER